MDPFNASFAPSADILSTFRGTPRRVQLLPGARLYRFETFESELHPEFRRKPTFQSEWWFMQPTFHNLCRAARAAGASLRDAGRSRLAVMDKWNPDMDWLAVIQLMVPGVAWVGPARTQRLSKENPVVMLLGNFDQAWVPGLAAGGKEMSNRFATMLYYGSGATADTM